MSSEELDDLLLLAEHEPDAVTPAQWAFLHDLGIFSTPEAVALERLGWEAWYAEIFGESFVRSLATHHRQALKWHWDARTSLIARLVVQFLAYFSIWSRGHMKTTLARRMVVCDACLSTTAGTGGYALVVGGTKKKIRGTASSVEALLRSPKVRQYYPKLSEVKRSEMGSSKGWTTDLINTAAGYLFQFVGLDEGMAGANEEDIRPTFIIPDDIDNRKDSPTIAEHNFQIFTTEVLPMRQSNTLVFFAQNLISRFSVMYRIWKGFARVLTNRVLTDPIPAVIDLKTEVRTVNGIVKDVYLSGEPTWPQVWDAQRIQEEIDSYGLPAFLRECQHEVEQSKEGLVLKNYDDAVHVITRSQFAAVYGTRDIPQRWYKYGFNDWAKTKTQFHANVAGFYTVSGQNEPMPGAVFLFNPMSFPAGSQPEDVALRLLKSAAPAAPVGGGQVPWEDLVRDCFRRENLDAYLTDARRLIEERRTALSKVLPGVVGPLLARSNYVMFRGSHEQANDALAVYREAFGIPFHPTNPGGDGGVEFLNHYMKVDYSQPHPFRPGEKGYTRFFIVVEDDRFEFPSAMTPENLNDSDLARFQFRNWRYRDPKVTEAGEVEHGPMKLNDDFPNGSMMLFFDNSVRAAPMTKDEKVMAMLPQKLQPQEIAKVEDPHERARRLTAQVMQTQQIQKQHFPKPSKRNAVAAWRSLGKKR